MTSITSKAITQESPQATESAAANILKNKSFIIADDSPRQRRYFRELFESFGLICVGEASNGLDCILLAEKHKPDFVFLDVIMPVMHGVEAMQHLRNQHLAFFIVFITAIPDPETLANIRIGQAQVDAVFSKNDPPQTFFTVLSEIAMEHQSEAASLTSQTLPSYPTHKVA